MIPGIVLAAGDSSRMGRPKALLSIGPDGESFLHRIARVLREGGVEEVLVVLGRDGFSGTFWLSAMYEGPAPIRRM